MTGASIFSRLMLPQYSSRTVLLTPRLLEKAIRRQLEIGCSVPILFHYMSIELQLKEHKPKYLPTTAGRQELCRGVEKIVKRSTRGKVS